MDAPSHHPDAARAACRIAVVVFALAATDPAGAGEAGSPPFTVRYTLAFLGLPVGEATLAVAQGNGRYALDLSAALRGVAGFFVDGSGQAAVSGALSRSGAVTAGFRLESRYAGKPLVALLQIENGQVRHATVEPPPTPRPDRVPVTEQDKVGIVDPLSMLAIPVGPAPLAPNLCDRRIAVFDGATRADLVLSRGALVTVQDGAYRGPALDCRVRWVPISGHRALGTSVRRMAENDDLQVRLAPAFDGTVLLPLSITVATGWGTVRIEATEWGAKAASPPPVAAAAQGSVRIRLPNAR